MKRALPVSTNRVVFRIWGEATAFLHHTRRLKIVDALVVLGTAGLLYWAISVAREWQGPLRPAVEIDLSLRALPRYALFSLSRGLLAYGLSLTFTLIYGYWAAKDRRAERVLVPLLDILQSVPVLGFMPGLVLALVALFPRTNMGLEFAAVIMIFTGQAWNMTFSFYHSLRSVPQDLKEAATLYRFSWWNRLKWVELPFAAVGLVWNSMMSMAGGWFFLMITEAFVLGDKDFRLPGLGSYMSVAVAQGNGRAMVYAIFTMTAMIVLLDQLLWRPVVVWAQKFRIDEVGHQQVMSSWLLTRLRQSRLLDGVARIGRRGALGRARPLVPKAGLDRTATWRRVTHSSGRHDSSWVTGLSLLLFGLVSSVLVLGVWKLAHLIVGVPLAAWGSIVTQAGWTLGRVLLATAIGTLWALPAGLAIGLSPRLSNVLQPAVQVVASFPAPMLFPAVIAVLVVLGVSLDWGSIVLMLLGTQWYILFNVIAGAMAIPADLLESARSFRIRGWRRFSTLLAPSVFPHLVTGWVTAAGGAWNASIVSEYVTFRGQVLTARGLGAGISRAAEQGDFRGLAASVLVMSTVVVLFNRTVWRRCYLLAERRYSLNK